MIFKLRILFRYLITRYGRNFKDRAELERWQEKRIQHFLKWVVTRSSFYAKLFEGIPIDQWRKLPLLDKKNMMENFSALNTVGIDRDQAFELAVHSEESRDFTPMINGITVGLSSGTSGNRGLFLASDQERAIHAGTIMAKILPHSIFSKNRVAFFMRANSNLYTSSKSSRLKFEFFDLLITLDQQLAKLQGFNPTLLFAPPSMLIEIARAQKEGKLKINPIRIFSIAETLDPLDQKNIELAFGKKVHQIYQCTEGFLGASCKEGTLHLNEDCVHIEPEWLDESKTRFIPIVTDFTRTSQPIIRYRLNDILTQKKDPCPCGSPFRALEMIEGRADDVLYFASEREPGKWILVFPDFLRRAVIQSSSQIEEYLVVQSEPAALKISLKTSAVSPESIQESVRSEIEKLSKIMHATLPKIEFTSEFPIRDGKKLRRVIRTH